MRLTATARLLVKSQCGAVLAAQDPLGSSGRWPMPKLKSTNEASIFSEPYVAQALYRAFQTLVKRGYTAESLSTSIPWPSAYARIAFVFRSRPTWKLTKAQQIDLMNWLADSLAPKYQSTPFCLDGKNILLRRAELNTLAEKLNGSRCIDQRLVSQLDARLWMYTEMLYSRWHNLGHEFHGPYRTRGKLLLVKEWHDLHGFRDFMGALSASRVACYEFFTRNTVKIDLHNRLWSRKPFLSTLTGCVVEIDNRVASARQVQNLIAELDRRLAKGAHYLERLTPTALKIMNAEMEFFAIKELLKQAGQSIYPPQTLIKSIKRNELSLIQKRTLFTLSEFYRKITKQNLRIQFDPTERFKMYAGK